MGFSYDALHYHYQNPDFTALAQSIPDTFMILNHFGWPLGVGPYANQRDEILGQLKQDFVEMAKCDNMMVKLGGHSMPDNGFGWHENPKPPTSDEYATAQGDYFLYAIDYFGPERCMMESNFPVDRVSLSYAVLFNGMKKIVADFPETERRQLFHDTAARVYRL